MPNVTWTGDRAFLVGEALQRRDATAALGCRLLDGLTGCAPDTLYALRLDWAEADYRAASKTLEGEQGRLYAAIARASRDGKLTGELQREQGELYEAMGDLKKAWGTAH